MVIINSLWEIIHEHRKNAKSRLKSIRALSAISGLSTSGTRGSRKNSRERKVYRWNKRPHMNIRGIYKTSLIDFPGKISAVLFTGGCNLRCRYCHNPDLACNWQGLELSSNEEAIDLLRKRKNLIDGVTISGGEPTLSKNIDSFIEKIKELRLAVKLDSNGLQPEVISRT